MKKTFAVLAAAGALLGLGAMSAQAAPGSYDPNTGIVTVTNDVGGAGASYEIANSTVAVENGDTLTFEYRTTDVVCGGGTPRVFIQGGAYNSFDQDPGGTGACGSDTDGDGWFTVTGTVFGITDGTAGHTGFVNDNPSDLGTVEFRDLRIDGVAVLATAPKDKDACKKGGWQDGTARNQGQCVSSFAKEK